VAPSIDSTGQGRADATVSPPQNGWTDEEELARDDPGNKPQPHVVFLK
jgi:hypothetical protein